MYIYHALINALSIHMIHIDLNAIFYTHKAQSYKNILHKVLYGHTHTHTHTHTHPLYPDIYICTLTSIYIHN